MDRVIAVVVAGVAGCGGVADTDAQPSTDVQPDPSPGCDYGWPKRAESPANPDARGILGEWWVQARTWTEGGSTTEHTYPHADSSMLLTQVLRIDESGQSALWDYRNDCYDGAVYETSIGYGLTWNETEARAFSLEFGESERWTCVIGTDAPHWLRCEGHEGAAEVTLRMWRI